MHKKEKSAQHYLTVGFSVYNYKSSVQKYSYYRTQVKSLKFSQIILALPKVIYIQKRGQSLLWNGCTLCSKINTMQYLGVSKIMLSEQKHSYFYLSLLFSSLHIHAHILTYISHPWTHLENFNTGIKIHFWLRVTFLFLPLFLFLHDREQRN